MEQSFLPGALCQVRVYPCFILAQSNTVNHPTGVTWYALGINMHIWMRSQVPSYNKNHLWRLASQIQTFKNSHNRLGIILKACMLCFITSF